MAAPLIRARGITKRFTDDAPAVLDAVDFALDAGERAAIVGPSGSGKSTLLNILGGLLPPTEGTVDFDGREITSLTPDERAALRNTDVAFVFQFHHLLPQCTALENVLVPTLAQAPASRDGQAGRRAEELLARVGLAERMHQRPGRLSGGECQRVAVVRALINRPRLLLADEPTGALDSAASDRLADLLCTLNEEEGVAVVAVTHAESLARRMGRVYEIENGVLTERT